MACIGVISDNARLPAVIACPFCGEPTLYIYDDMTREDIWLNCDNCSAHGNIITFAAQIWKLDIPAAVDKLTQTGVCAQSNYAEQIAQIIKRQKRQETAAKLWSAAAEQLWTDNDTDIHHKLREFGVSREIPCHGMLGVAYAEQITVFAKTVRRVFPRHMQADAPTLVFPYYDLPGRFSGFLLAQYGEEFAVKRSFLPMSGQMTSRTDAGYYMLNTALLPPHPILKNSHFIVDDPVWVIKAQTTQLRHGAELLPLCASYAGTEANSNGLNWRSFPPTRRFFYSRIVAPGTISQAEACRGYVCPAQPENAAQPATPARTIKRLAAICKTAMPWQAALARIFATTNLIAAQAFASKLSISKERLQQFFSEKTKIPPDVALKIIERVQRQHGIDPRKSSYSNEIVEREDGWYTATGLCLINCVPVITRIIYADKDKKYYEGYIKKNSRVYAFFEASERVEKLGLLQFVEHTLAAHGELTIVAGYKNSRALPTALKLHPPEIVRVSNKPGWDENTRKFQFTGYALTHDGDVVPTECPQLKTNKQLDLPAPNTAAPLTISALLTPAHENAFIWAVTASTLANMVAPILNKDAVSIGIPAAAFDAASACGKMLGCESVALEHVYRSSLGSAVRFIGNAEFPTFVKTGRDRDKASATAVIKYPNRPALLRIQQASVAAVCSYGWTALVPLVPPAADTDYSALQFIVAAYIQRVLRNRSGVGAANQHLVLAVLQDMHSWLAETYGATFNYAAAEKTVVLPAQSHMALMRELNHAITTEKIAIIPRPRNKTQAGNYVLRDKEHWWLNQKALDEYLAVHGIVPNWNALLNCFTKQGVFCGETVVRGMPGLLIKRAWCDTFWSDYSDSAAKDAG